MARREPWLIERARAMRRNPTLGERILWGELRDGRFGVRFRRQEVIGNTIVDFACHSRRVILEVDGDSHDDPAADARRDAFLERCGWTVIRIWDHDLIAHREAMLEMIWNALHPLPPRAGGDAPEGQRGE